MFFSTRGAVFGMSAFLLGCGEPRSNEAPTDRKPSYAEQMLDASADARAPSKQSGGRFGMSSKDDEQGVRSAEFGDQVPPDLFMAKVYGAISDGDFAVMWASLPDRFREDAEHLKNDFADVLDPELYDRTYDVVRKLGRVLKEKKMFVLNGPVRRSLPTLDAFAVASVWDSIAETVELVANSELGTFETYRQTTLDQIIERRANEIFKRLIGVARALVPGMRQAFDEIAETRFRIHQRTQSTAVLRRETPGLPVQLDDYLYVEGKWVRQDWWDEWDAEIATRRRNISGISNLVARKAEYLKNLRDAEQSLDRLLKCEDQQSFDRAAEPVLAWLNTVFATYAESAASGKR
jgi:hypothetical protein